MLDDVERHSDWAFHLLYFPEANTIRSKEKCVQMYFKRYFYKAKDKLFSCGSMSQVCSVRVFAQHTHHNTYAVVTPLRKAASYEPRIAILGMWGDTWLTRGKYGIYMVVTGSMWRLLPRKISPIYCRVSYVAVTRIPSLVHYVIIRYSYGELPKFVLRCSYEAALRKGVTTALHSHTDTNSLRNMYSHPHNTHSCTYTHTHTHTHTYILVPLSHTQTSVASLKCQMDSPYEILFNSWT